jgi:uncharacterized damage-inducible protein DinB
MRIGEVMAAELKHEAVATRKTLERVPKSDYGWRPHAKSMTMGRLASHLADMMSWVDSILTKTEMVFDPASYKPWEASGTEELISRFDSGLAAAISLLESIDDSAIMVPWSLKVGGQEVFKMPRVGVMRGMVLSHMIHHRAQLGLYLRMRDVAVPAAYGPSADEQS